ncbi:DUF2255 family protein [Streptomyces sp. NPDC101455]|uniref:DUF2255 family protein n=1 Tax=Streptomyces sp. NPDC101455 TaxID=3366142 RepID=UPI003818FDC8
MTTWTNDELSRIENADELEIAPLRGNGTPRKPVPIWVVREGDHLYVRSYRGSDGSWWRAALASHAGHVRAGGVDKEVTFVEESDACVNDRIDSAYRAKYSRYGGSYVAPMIASRDTTLKLVPR